MDLTPNYTTVRVSGSKLGLLQKVGSEFLWVKCPHCGEENSFEASFNLDDQEVETGQTCSDCGNHYRAKATYEGKKGNSRYVRIQGISD